VPTLRLARRLIVMALLVVACQAPVTTTSPPATQAHVTLAIVGGVLVDGTGAEPVRDAVVLIDGDRIVAVGPSGTVGVPSGIATVDAHGGTILPGFINAHVHRGFSTANLRAWAAGGVTTVRDESAAPGQVAGLRQLQAQGEQDATLARLVSAGSMLAVPGGYGDLTVTSIDDAVAAVDLEVDEGVGAVKVALEDGYAGRHDLPKPDLQMLRAIVSRAHERGVRVSGHVTQAAYVPELLAAGVDDVAHVPYDPVPDGVLAQMASSGVYLVPTFTVFRNYGAPVEGCVDNVRRFVAAGGTVALGNDYGGGPGDFELGIPMFEIEELAAAGLTPMEIIEASTRDGARALGLVDEIGTIRAGMSADVLVVGGDPLVDLQALTRILTVVHAGVVIRSTP
jgi:imidazolonepropionase-like amidohydrolase